ncbi:MAG: hypothetical protein JXR84_22710 [Anaerolineae bacterium]|nr:hypothetical protein [Anaerolineae bacterium]
MQEAKWVADGVINVVKAEAEAVRKVWSLMEAATEKKRPSEIVSQGAIQRIQGKRLGG